MRDLQRDCGRERRSAGRRTLHARRADPARLETTRASNERRAGPHPDAPDQEEHGETTRLEIGLEQSRKAARFMRIVRHCRMLKRRAFIALFILRDRSTSPFRLGCRPSYYWRRQNVAQGFGACENTGSSNQVMQPTPKAYASRRPGRCTKEVEG